jgi:hypothetical protein
MFTARCVSVPVEYSRVQFILHLLFHVCQSCSDAWGVLWALGGWVDSPPPPVPTRGDDDWNRLSASSGKLIQLTGRAVHHTYFRTGMSSPEGNDGWQFFLPALLWATDTFLLIHSLLRGSSAGRDNTRSVFFPVYQNRLVWTSYPAGLKVSVSYSAKAIRLGGNIAIAFVPANTWHSGVGGVHTSRGGDGGESGGGAEGSKWGADGDRRRVVAARDGWQRRCTRVHTWQRGRRRTGRHRWLIPNRLWWKRRLCLSSDGKQHLS